MAKKKKDQEYPGGKRSIRSYFREIFGLLSEAPVFENQYYDLFNTPLDTFQEHFPKGGRHGYLYTSPEGEEQWVDVDRDSLYALWRKAGAPSIYDKEGRGSVTRPREYTFGSTKFDQALGYLFGAPEMHLGDKGMFPAQKFIEESGHQVMFENPELFGYKSRRDLINDKIRENEEWKDMTTRQRYDSYYTNPGIQSSGLQSQEHVAHKQVVPKLIDWLVSR